MMKIALLTFCVLACTLPSHAAELTLTEINARLEKVEAELKLSQNKLALAENKIAVAEKRASDAELKNKNSKSDIINDDTEIKFGGYARTGILSGKQGTTTTVGPSLTPAGSTGGSVGHLGNEADTYVTADFDYKRHYANDSSFRYYMKIAEWDKTYNTDSAFNGVRLEKGK